MRPHLKEARDLVNKTRDKVLAYAEIIADKPGDVSDEVESMTASVTELRAARKALEEARKVKP